MAVLASGMGSNLEVLIGDQRLQIVAVISDRGNAPALAGASAAGIPCSVVGWKGNQSLFTSEICRAAEEQKVEALVLAGFMRILGGEAIHRYPLRIVNVHPSLLPAFPGAHAIEYALAAGVKVTGVTVHFVDEEVDHGPIICQETVEVYPDDDVASLHARIQKVEHVVYPEAVAALAEGRLTVSGRKVLWT